jgi:hypothetical protein
MDTNLPFKNEKPNKDGIWLWRIKKRELIGVASMRGDDISELVRGDAITLNVDVWWDEELMEAYFVG